MESGNILTVPKSVVELGKLFHNSSKDYLMQYKPYGKTGKDISIIGCGGMQFENPDDIDSAAETVLHAYRQGVNYFDTAPYYCKDKSEDIFGAAIKQMEPGNYYISTKSGQSDGTELTKSLKKSLKRLGVERIDFFHIWCVITLEDWAKRKSGGDAHTMRGRKEIGVTQISQLKFIELS